MLNYNIEQDDSWPVNSWETLMSLPPVLQKGLTAVCMFAFLSFVLTSFLAVHLAYQLCKWKRGTHTRLNQFVILIFNLLLADLQQSTAFLLNAEWLRLDSIIVETHTCFAQGWFVSVGDLASGAFTFVMAMHCFADIVFDFRLSHTRFMLALAGLWTFIYACAIIGVAMHPHGGFYTRAGSWCWVNAKYSQERLWLHYFWVIIAEFGTLIIYGLIFLTIQQRIKSAYYATSEMQYKAQTAAKLVVVYPLVYVVCTLPLVVARLRTMAGQDVSFTELCITGAMITSNGWLDVLLYSLTRRALVFGPGLTSENVRALDTFLDNNNSNWRADSVFGNTTTIEAMRPMSEVEACHHKQGRRNSSITSFRSNHLKRYSSRIQPIAGRRPSVLPSIAHHLNDSLEDLFESESKYKMDSKAVKTETVVEVTRSDAIIPISPFCRQGEDYFSAGKTRDSFEMSTTSRASEAISPCSNPPPWEDMALGAWPKDSSKDGGR